MKNEWTQWDTGTKVLFLLRVAASIGALICALLRLLHIWEQAMNLGMPLLGTAMLIQSVQEWRKNPVSAVGNLCVALFIFVCCAVVWFMM